jgi:hypothetical protein
MDDRTSTEASGSGDGAVPDPDLLRLDGVFVALAHPRRRYLCYSLLSATEWSLRDLAAKVAAWETDRPEHAVDEDRRERVYLSLYHAHVPRLVDEGIVTFDPETEQLATGPHADRVRTVLERLGASEDAGQEAHARSEMTEDDDE